MRIALVSPYSWTYPGGVTRHIEALAERFIAGRASRTGARALRSAGHVRRRSCTAARARRRLTAARLPGLARPDRRLQGQRRGLQPDDHYAWRGGAAPRAADRRLRRGPRPRAGRSAGRLGGHRLDPAAARRHLPLLFGELVCQRAREPDRRSAGAQPPARADRRLGGGRLDREALVRRPLPGDPQRRSRRSRRAQPRRHRTAVPDSCGSCSSARPSSARACRCCCARSRRCASTSPPS